MSEPEAREHGPRERPSRQPESRERRPRRPRSPASLAVASILAAVACSPDAAPERLAETGPAARPTYQVRLDSESSDMAEFRLVEDDDGIRVRTGPAGIAYRSENAIASGGMHVQATFRQYDAPVGYREAYGLFVGGLDLNGPDLEYTYLLIRPTGEYLVKRRVGETTETLADWTPHPAVQGVRSEGDQPRNTLAIDVFEGVTHFLVNGDVVHTEATGRARPHGIAGVRVNHRLDVRVDRWLMEQAEPAPEPGP